MKGLWFVIAAVSILGLCVSCAKIATPAECKSVCERQASFVETAKPVEDPVRKVESDFETRLEAVQKEQLAAMQEIDGRMKTEIEGVEGAEAADEINKKFSEEKSAKAAEFAPKFKEINVEKTKAVKATREAKAKAEADAKASAEKAIQTCADKCIKDRTTKAKADCRMKAGTLEEFGRCK